MVQVVTFKVKKKKSDDTLHYTGSKCSVTENPPTLTPLLLVHFPRALCSLKNILWSGENAAGKDRPWRPSALTAPIAVVIFMRTKFDEFPVRKCTGHIPGQLVSSSIPATAHLSNSKKKKKDKKNFNQNLPRLCEVLQ